VKYKISNLKSQISNSKDLIKILLRNRGIKTKKEIEEFLNPRLETVTVDNVGIDKKQLKRAISRIELAIKNKEQIVVFGDYDVDGICGTAVLWEVLNSLGAKAMPYIPHRIDEGYGLSIKGINNVILNLFQDPKKKKMLKQVQHDNKKGLIITVDNGIVASKAVDFANKQGVDVIITDHHVLPIGGTKQLPKALAIVHTTKLCGAGVAYLLSRVILNSFQDLRSQRAEMLKPASQRGEQVQHDKKRHLELVALATVADLVPLKGANRTLLKFGLEELRKTKRIGLLELFKEAGIDKAKIGVYEIGHIIAPRLNAMGRLEYAMDSLRLICTNDQKRAEKLAGLLGNTNRERQDLTLQTVLHAKDYVRVKREKLSSLLFIAHESYGQGIIGLVAGKLVEEFYKPAIVISKGKKISKASARSIKGFNMIEFIRGASELLIDAGGHPMAAGFTVETAKLSRLQKVLEKRAELLLSKDLLTRSLKIDCELSLLAINIKLYEALQELSPFGMGNPEPTFISKKVVIDDMRLVGVEGKHLKLKIKDQKSNIALEGIGFGMGGSTEMHVGDKVDIAYVIAEDEWLARQSLVEGGNGDKRLQLKIKDIR